MTAPQPHLPLPRLALLGLAKPAEMSGRSLVELA